MWKKGTYKKNLDQIRIGKSDVIDNAETEIYRNT